jgi:hypothetical protein
MNGLLKGEQNIIKEGETEYKEGMKPLEMNIKLVSGGLKDMRATHEEVTHAMTEDLYKYRQALSQVEQDEKGALAPLKQGAEEAAEAVSKLEKETEKADLAYTKQKEVVSDQQYEFEKMAKTLMGPLDQAYEAASANVTQIQDELSALGDRWEAKLEPLRNKAAQMQEELTALGEEFANKLRPIDDELKQIGQQEQGDDRASKIEGQAQALSNLNARLAAAIPHSEKYNELERERDDMQKKLGRNQRVDELTKEKEKLEEARDAALQKKEEDLKAAQQALKDQEARRDADLKSKQEELKAAEALQKQADKARSDEAKLLDEKRQEQAEEAANIARQQELYDRAQRDKLAKANEDKDVADQALADAQANWAAKKQLIQDDIDATNHKLEVYQHDAGEQERLMGLTLTGLQDEKTKRDDNYNAWKEQEQDKLADHADQRRHRNRIAQAR